MILIRKTFMMSPFDYCRRKSDSLLYSRDFAVLGSDYPAYLDYAYVNNDRGGVRPEISLEYK